ncbi:unnamed protein product [Prunus armeniaca]
MLAAMHGKISCVEMLLDAGATALVFFYTKKGRGWGIAPNGDGDGDSPKPLKRGWRWGWGQVPGMLLPYPAPTRPVAILCARAVRRGVKRDGPA